MRPNSINVKIYCIPKNRFLFGLLIKDTRSKILQINLIKSFVEVIMTTSVNN